MKLDGLQPEAWGLKPIESHVHPSPDMRQNVMFIPGRPGLWDFGSQLEARRFERPFAIVERDPLERQRKLREFTAFLFDSYGRPRELKLTFDYEPDKYYSVKFTGQITPDRYYNLATFTLPLVAHEPYAKSLVTSDEITMGSDIPIMSDIFWGTGISSRTITAPDSFTVVNNGTVATRFSYKLEGSGNNVSISANGKSFSVGSFVDKVFEIDGENFTVKVNGLTDLTSTNGEFIELLPGMNEVKVDGLNLNLTISESLTYKYI